MKRIKTVIHGAALALALSYQPAVLGADYDSYINKTELMFPLVGAFIVNRGGRTLEQNKNHLTGAPAGKYALDIAGVRPETAPLPRDEIEYYKKKGLTIAYTGDVNNNANHYCFGRNVVAPAAGKLVSIGRGIKDNIHGVLNEQHPRGNYVMIDHGNNEVSLLLHLRYQSIPVRLYEGMPVSKGMKVGECGNSGYSRGVHLHYQLQDSTQFSTAKGLPVQFSDLIVNNKRQQRVELKQGDIVKQQPTRLLDILKL
ncbi:M23 family metallopeptidase [Microbulbifer sp.]|uniref:M23 family metallopeptidase n=1 Tax=Microbulbifer sp. TaxID=1908541 RepID=UPI003F2CA790